MRVSHKKRSLKCPIEKAAKVQLKKGKRKKRERERKEREWEEAG